MKERKINLPDSCYEQSYEGDGISLFLCSSCSEVFSGSSIIPYPKYSMKGYTYCPHCGCRFIHWEGDGRMVTRISSPDRFETVVEKENE